MLKHTARVAEIHAPALSEAFTCSRKNQNILFSNIFAHWRRRSSPTPDKSRRVKASLRGSLTRRCRVAILRGRGILVRFWGRCEPRELAHVQNGGGRRADTEG